MEILKQAANTHPLTSKHCLASQVLRNVGSIPVDLFGQSGAVEALVAAPSRESISVDIWVLIGEGRQRRLVINRTKIS